MLCRNLDPEELEVTARAWADLMPEIDDAMLGRAVRRYLRSGKYWPAPADIIQAADEITREIGRERQQRALPEAFVPDAEYFANQGRKARELLASLEATMQVPQ